MKNKQFTIYVDMDDTIADFIGHFTSQGKPVDETEMYAPGFFLNLKPIPGAQVAIRQLIKDGHDVHILTQPVANSPQSYAEKAQWIGMWFPELIDKINMTQNKGLFIGDILIDDNFKKWAGKFQGTFLHFIYTDGYHEQQWGRIVREIRNRSGI